MGLVGTAMLEDLKEQIRKAFTKIKLELNDHRESINENTNELQTNYEYLCRLDAKIEKLTERVDELVLFIGQVSGKQQKKYHVDKLTRNEQEVFMALYTYEKNGIANFEVARKVGLSVDLVSLYISNLIVKGIPILKRMVNDTVHYFLDPEFKIYQAKENILGINQDIAVAITMK
ncbi:hypothetical protein HYY69_07210 [Candidatus Woesearchaeota archaeon]|nr:hypothetical protein [Candidatus Woesearchaeota archaeon]